MLNEVKSTHSGDKIGKEIKKSLFNRFWWLWAIIVVLIGVILIFFKISDDRAQERGEQKQEQAEKTEAVQREKEDQEAKDRNEGRKPPMTAEEVAKANEVLALGIEIDDEQNDYAKVKPGTIQPDGRPDNSNPWPLPFTDLKKFQIGADEKNLYVKYTFYGTFPNEMYRNGEDFLAGLGGNLGLREYFNHNTNKLDGSALYQLGITYAANSNNDDYNGAYGAFFNPPKLNTSTFGEANSEVKDKNNEDTYGIATDAGKIFGGVGYDYMMAAFPLRNTGLLLGDTISFDVTCESGSKVYHHQSIDPLLDFGSLKFGEMITWKIGSNTYTSVIPKE